MIQYHRAAFGLNLLKRVNGSAVYRATIPGLISVGFLLIMRFFWRHNKYDALDGDLRYDNPVLRDPKPNDELFHPYVIGVLLAGVSFLLVFRLQQGYARYWEAAGCVHHMMSKWMDAVIHTAAYHLQCKHYDAIKPPSYFDYGDLDQLYLTREREQHTDLYSNIAQSDQFGENNEADNADAVAKQEQRRVHKRAKRKSIETVDAPSYKIKNGRFSTTKKAPTHQKNNFSKDSIEGIIENGVPDNSAAAIGNALDAPKGIIGGEPPSDVSSGMDNDFLLPYILEGPPRLDGNWGDYYSLDGQKKATFMDPRYPRKRDPAGFASIQGGRTPPLFLQELCHLASLMSGVALSTLRNDIEGAQSPLDIYTPGAPWPEVDPDKIVDASKEEIFGFKQKFKLFLGYGRTSEDRTKYNASRPLPVIGGVSDGEIRFLQMARGPSAKTQLCWYWLSEFVTREHLAGSTGNVGPPIISRIIQFLGDGMIYYNHARKIMFIPFPFPHAQLSVVFVLLAIPVVAFLMDQYCAELWIACVLTFLTVTVFTGMHEVARELENPFRNVPNELPLVTLQAQFNEALIVMYSGYHPDAYWQDSARALRKEQVRQQTHNERAAAAAAAKQPGTDTDAAVVTPTEEEKGAAVAGDASTISDTADTTASATTTTTGSATATTASAPSPASPTAAAMEEKMKWLIMRMEEQSLEIERLRLQVNQDETTEESRKDR